MRKINYLITEAFADKPFCGNPAGIIPDASQLTEQEMQQIAQEFSTEFGFFTPATSSRGDFRARFFTPACEARISGHVAVAGCHALSSEGFIDFPSNETTKTITIETNAGYRSLTLNRLKPDDISVAFELAKPRFGRIYDPKSVEISLGLPAKSILATRLWPQVVSTGIRVLVVPIRNREILYGYKPDFQKVAQYSQALNIGGPVFCSMQTLDPGANIYNRYFFPEYGTNEDIASGVAFGAIGCYLVRHVIQDVGSKVTIISEQGHTLQRPNKMTAEIKIDDEGNALSIKVLGKGLIVSRGRLFLP